MNPGDVSWLPWLPTLATVAGWAVVNWQANRRESRKEQRSVMDAAKRLAVETASKSAAYMCADERSEAIEADIKSCLDQIEIELGRIDGYPKVRSLVEAMAEFGDAATGADFESATRRARPRTDPAVLRVMVARNRLMRELEVLFSQRFC